MINNMPIISGQSWTPMLDESPIRLTDHSKNFFDYADTDTLAFDYKGELIPASALVAEDGFIPMEDAETTYTTMDSAKVIVTWDMTDADGQVMCIPTTALEMVECEEAVVPDPAQDIAFLNANLPAPLGSQPVTMSFPLPTTAQSPLQPSTSFYQPPTTPSPFQPPSPAFYPQTPRTPSCQSTCSDDVSSTATMSDVGTPTDISSVTSGEKFLIPLPSDDKMAAATLTALETCSLTPLIKEELKYTIQSRRLAAGKPELVVDTNPTVKVKKTMTAEERERATKRRHQNREAAQRFRQKQKDTADVLTKKCQRLEGSNTTLRAEIKRLARESQELKHLLAAHLRQCPKVKVAR